MAAAPDWKDQIKKILQENDNSKCADCGEDEATWAVHNLGVFVCIKCSGVHRQLGVHVSKVKSTEYDKWTQDQLDVCFYFIYLLMLFSISIHKIKNKTKRNKTIAIAQNCQNCTNLIKNTYLCIFIIPN